MTFLVMKKPETETQVAPVPRALTAEFAADAVLDCIASMFKCGKDNVKSLNHWMNAADDWINKYEDRGGDLEVLQDRLRLKYGSTFSLPPRKAPADV